MRAVTVARRLLSFPCMSVGKVRFEPQDLGGEILVVEVTVRGRSRCSRCGRKCSGYDELKPRRWRHLDFGAYEVHLEATLSRVDCPRCGVVVEKLSWAEAGSRFTVHFEEFVGWLAQRCDKTAISTMLRIAWRTVGSILERVVARRRDRIDWTKVTAIAVDELSYRKGHHYLTLVSDLEKGRILWSKEGRSAATLKDFFAEIGPEACARIRHAAIDMFEGYVQAIRSCLPNAKIVFDRFHVQQLASKAVDEVRRSEWRLLRGTDEARGIKNLRWALLHNPWNVTPAQGQRLADLPRQNATLYRAYLLKESLAGVYRRLYTPPWAKRRLTEWIAWAARSRLAPFLRVSRTLRRYFDGVLAYFETGYTTSRAEGLNTKARLATRQAYGFHSADAVRAMIELRCSGITIQLPHQLVAGLG
jgi:transposase